MGKNHIDSMQCAFDLLTQPAVYIRELIEVEQEVSDGQPLRLDRQSPAGRLWELVALYRLHLAY